MKRNKILHVRSTFLELTETFIYNYLIHLNEFENLVVCNYRINKDNFRYNEKNIFIIGGLCKIEKIVNIIKWNLFASTYMSVKYGYVIGGIIPDLIHAHFAPSGELALIASKKHNIPLVVSFYGYDISRLPKDSNWQRALKNIFENGALFLAEGPFMKKQLVNLGCPIDKIKIQHIAIDVDRINYKPRELGSGEKIVILMCARFTEKKGIPYAIKSFNNLMKYNENIELRIIGDGPKKGELVALISELGLQDKIKITGFLRYEEYLKEADNAHLFLMPSITASDGDSEGGAPTVLLEMQAMGIPVVATRHADIPYVVNGKSGFLVNEKDVKGLTQALKEVVASPKKWAYWGKNGREWVEERHDIKKEAKKLQDIYHGLINNG